MNDSPYHGLAINQWRQKTLELVEEHPLGADEIYEIVSKVWGDIFRSGIGSKPFKIGVDIFPTPQIMGFFLHELLPLELEFRYPEFWRRNNTSAEKDLVYLPDDGYSVEIKTSSSPHSIYGNRSYAQISAGTKKSKSGYYLAVNFEKFAAKRPGPRITLVRFGWLDHEEGIGQTTATGQQARLSPFVERNKLIELPLHK